MGEDFRVLTVLSRTTTSGVPAVAVAVQISLTLLLIITSVLNRSSSFPVRFWRSIPWSLLWGVDSATA